MPTASVTEWGLKKKMEEVKENKRDWAKLREKSTVMEEDHNIGEFLAQINKTMMKMQVHRMDLYT